jgi:hypothetical protein
MANADYARAQALFEASYRAEPALGALLNLAVCEEKLGHLNAAVAHLEQSLREAPALDERRPSIAARVEHLRARIPHLVLRSEQTLAPGVSVTLDGQPIERASFGVPLSIDPGLHKIRCTDRHMPVCSRDLVVAEKESAEWSIVTTEPPRPRPAVPPSPHPAPRSKPARPEPKSRTPLVLATGAIGLAGLGVGLLGGAQVLHSKNTMEEHCDEGGCDPEGIRAAARGRTWSWVSNVGIGVGVLGLGSSAYFALTARSSQGRGAELAVRGSF